MALTKLTDNVSNVSSLDDKPSLSSTELKRVFDRGNESIKEYREMIDDWWNNYFFTEEIIYKDY